MKILTVQAKLTQPLLGGSIPWHLLRECECPRFINKPRFNLLKFTKIFWRCFMKTLKAKAYFIVSCLGGQAGRDDQEFLEDLFTDRLREAVLSEKEKKLQRLDQDKEIKKMTSVFNYFDNKPILGGWMLHACFMNAAQVLGFTERGGENPGRSILDGGVVIEPRHIFLHRNGKVVDKIDRYQVEKFKPKYGSKTGIVKVHEVIDPPAEFQYEVHYVDTLKEKQIKAIVMYMGKIGAGPFRKKYGGFEVKI